MKKHLKAIHTDRYVMQNIIYFSISDKRERTLHELIDKNVFNFSLS